MSGSFAKRLSAVTQQMQQEEDETLEGDGRGDHSELLQAARDGDAAVVSDVVRSIAAKGGSIDALASDKGTTALMLAAGAGHAEVVALLLAAGCDPSLRNQFGDTALKMAAAAKHAKVLALLPGGLHDFDHVNAKSTPCISCQRVVGAGRAGVFCIACRRCRACAESLECEAGRTTARSGTPTGLRRLLGGGGRSREGSMNKGQRAGGSGEPSPLAARPR